MKKIIRVTESELIKLIGKVINEQATSTPTDAGYAPYYNFRTGQMAGTAAPKPQSGPAMNPKADPTKFTQQAAPNIACVGLKSPETNKTIKGINGEVIKFYNNGRFVDVKNQKGNYVCGQYPNIINLMYDSDPQAVKYFNMTPQPAAPKVAPKPPAKVKAKPDPKVMELQKQLVAAGYDIGEAGVDGIMGPKTRAAQQLMIQQKGQQAIQNLTQKGKEFGAKLKQNIQQNSQPPM